MTIENLEQSTRSKNDSDSASILCSLEAWPVHEKPGSSVVQLRDDQPPVGKQNADSSDRQIKSPPEFPQEGDSTEVRQEKAYQRLKRANHLVEPLLTTEEAQQLTRLERAITSGNLDQLTKLVQGFKDNPESLARVVAALNVVFHTVGLQLSRIACRLENGTATLSLSSSEGISSMHASDHLTVSTDGRVSAHLNMGVEDFYRNEPVSPSWAAERIRMITVYQLGLPTPTWFSYEH